MRDEIYHPLAKLSPYHVSFNEPNDYFIKIDITSSKCKRDTLSKKEAEDTVFRLEFIPDLSEGHTLNCMTLQGKYFHR